MRITSLTPMKNEAPFLLEWVAYHRLIGVNDILVFSNDCTDGTDRMLERLDELGLVRHFANPSFLAKSDKHHLMMMRYVNRLERVRRSDWVISLDADEFVCVNAGQGHLLDLFAAVPEANVWYMSQQNFGHGGVAKFDQGLVIDQSRWGWDQGSAYHGQINRRGVKSMTHRSSEPVAIHNHCPIFTKGDLAQARVHNGSGLRLRHLRLWEDVKSLDKPYYGFDLVQVNHYPLRSIDAFLLKVARGNANHGDLSYGMRYWQRYDHNDARHDGITRWSARVAEERDRLLSDPELRDLHQTAVEQAKATIDRIKCSAEGLALLRQIREYTTARSADQAPAKTSLAVGS